jgi:hypothetical protein
MPQLLRNHAGARLISPLADDRPWRATSLGAADPPTRLALAEDAKPATGKTERAAGRALPFDTPGEASARATAPPTHVLDDLQALCSQYLRGVEPARLAHAFAKVDLQKKGQLPPADVSRVLRELGVPAPASQVPLRSAPDAAVSQQESIDYLALVASLASGQRAPPSPDAAPSGSQPVHRSTRYGPSSGNRRHYGIHDPSQGGAMRQAMAHAAAMDNPTLALHTHTAFDSAAGLDAQKIASHSAQAQAVAMAAGLQMRRGCVNPQMQSMTDTVVFGR